MNNQSDSNVVPCKVVLLGESGSLCHNIRCWKD